jgi:hypothetical protein
MSKAGVPLIRTGTGGLMRPAGVPRQGTKSLSEKRAEIVYKSKLSSSGDKARKKRLEKSDEKAAQKKKDAAAKAAKDEKKKSDMLEKKARKAAYESAKRLKGPTFWNPGKRGKLTQDDKIGIGVNIGGLGLTGLAALTADLEADTDPWTTKESPKKFNRRPRTSRHKKAEGGLAIKKAQGGLVTNFKGTF